MKKLLILAAAIITHAAAASAQWTTENLKGDDLTGSKPDIYHLYTDSIHGYTFAYWESSNEQYIISSGKQVFDVVAGYNKYAGHYCGIEVTVGIYTNDEKLIEKFKMWLDVDAGGGTANYARTRNAGKMLNPVGQAKKVKKILKHLTSSDGYVRIVANLYGGSPFDLTIPHL